jgi:hypothetical protein
MMVVGTVVLALLLIGVLYQRIGAQRSQRAPIGTLIDVGGHRLHVNCAGAGSPVVLFEAGIAASSLSWALVQPAIARFTRVCAYDRAGLAWSDPPSSPRTFTQIVDELGRVLRRSGLASHASSLGTPSAALSFADTRRGIRIA